MRMIGNTNCSTFHFFRTEASQSRSFVHSVDNSDKIPLCTHVYFRLYSTFLAVLFMNFCV